LRGLFPFRR